MIRADERRTWAVSDLLWSSAADVQMFGAAGRLLHGADLMWARAPGFPTETHKPTAAFHWRPSASTLNSGILGDLWQIRWMLQGRERERQNTENFWMLVKYLFFHLSHGQSLFTFIIFSNNRYYTFLSPQVFLHLQTAVITPRLKKSAAEPHIFLYLIKILEKMVAARVRALKTICLNNFSPLH